ncbi:MAG: AAA family ATPase, partial [Planctomycetota bacterium]
QNPIEQEGTYTLPEAQLDRFMFMLHVDYPEREQEMEVLRRTTGGPRPAPSRVFRGDEVRALQDLVRSVPVPEELVGRVVDLVRATRPGSQTVPEVSEWLQWGAGPRSGQMLLLGAKARALWHGRFHVSSADIRTLAHPVLRHRLVINFAGQAEGVDADQLINRLLENF